MPVINSNLNFTPKQPSLKGVFVSDLHVFSGRSVGESLPNQLPKAFPDANLLVLGGDIFDFKWSHLGETGTLVAAERWLLSVLEEWQGKVMFLAGNHDCLPKFLDVMQNVAHRCDRFSWHDHHVQLGDALFLHGDVLDAGSHVSMLADYRYKFHPTCNQTTLSRRAYSAIVAMRLHRMAPKLRHRQLQTCQKLYNFLPQLVETPKQVRRVFYGHTHVSMAGCEFQGVQFFNPGAAVRHIAFRPIQFEV